MDQLGKHIQGLQQRALHLEGLSAKTDAAEGKILQAAQHRLEAVQVELRQLRPRLMAQPDLAERYTALVMERGQLSMVISQANQHLGHLPNA